MINLPQLRVDTANHFVYGSIIFLVAMVWQAVWQVSGAHLDNSMWVVSACALGKEALDRVLNLIAAYRGRPATHGVEWTDFLATHLGGASTWASAHLAGLTLSLSSK